MLEAHLQLMRRFPIQNLIRACEKIPKIYGYNSARDELFLADNANRVVCEMSLRDNTGDLRDLHRAPDYTSSNTGIWSVPYERLGHTARVFRRSGAGQESKQLAGDIGSQRK